MSVLLEALKKAAEDKKKALENSEQSNKVEDSLVQKDTTEKNTMPKASEERKVLGSKVQAVLNKPAKIKLSLNESVTSAPIESIKNPEIAKTAPPPISKEIPTVALKLDLNLDNIQKSEKKSNALNVTDKEASNEEPKLSLRLEVEEKTDQNNSFLDKTLTEEVVTLSTTQDRVESSSPLDGSVLRTVDASDEPIVEPSRDSLKGEPVESAQISEKLKEYEAVDLSLARKDLDEVLVAPVLTKNAEDSLHDVALDDAHQGSPEIELIVQSDSTPLKAEFNQSERLEELPTKDEGSPAHQPLSSVKKPNLKVDKNALKEDEDSYKWSLDALPGYLGLGKKKKRKKDSTEGGNPILVAGALSEDPARPTKKSSVKLVLILLVFLLLMGIIFYGVFYYQEQHDALEQRMKKYNLVKTHITVEEGASTVNKASGKSIETPSLNPKKESLSDVPLGDVVHKKESIEDVQKESLVYTGRSDPFEKDNQTRMEAQSQSDIEKPVTLGTVTQKREAAALSLESGSNNRVTNAPKISVQSLDKKITETVNNTPRKAVIVVHSEEEVLSEAYLSYGQGDFTRAQQTFETVLTMNPQNEFALIGLGNILASDQQYSAAMVFYQKVLVAQPSSLNAFEAMANISGHIELNSDWKSALSEMAQDHSESATLQYALGNVYAEENDWLSAQSAYFQAVVLEPDNADYLVNLAVSLDQLGKYQLAARYYTEALAFVDVEAVNFNETQVKNRLISIRQFIAGRTQ